MVVPPAIDRHTPSLSIFPWYGTHTRHPTARVPYINPETGSAHAGLIEAVHKVARAIDELAG